MTPEAVSDQRADERRAAKAQADKNRRAMLKSAQAGAEFAGLDFDELDLDQRKRAAEHDHKKGLGKGAFAEYVRTGKSMRQQTDEAAANRKAENATAQGEARTRSSKDPDAAEWNRRAVELNPDRRAEFELRDGRAWIDEYELTDLGDGDDLVTVVRKMPDGEKVEEKFNVKKLEKFAMPPRTDDGELRRQLSRFSKGSFPTSTRLALLILAAVRRAQAGD